MMNAIRQILLLAGFVLPVATVQAEDRTVSERVAEQVEYLEVDDALVRGMAVEHLSDFGPEARPAVKPLIRLLADNRSARRDAFSPSVSSTAEDALVAIGSEAVESLNTALGVQSADTRARAASVLGRIGIKASQSLPALAIAVRDPEERVRAAAVRAIGRIAKADESIEAILSECLRDQSAIVRVTAAQVLGAMANASERTETALLVALHDVDPMVRARAARALGVRGKAPEIVVPALIPLLKDGGRAPVMISSCLAGEERVAVAAADALREFRGRAHPAGGSLFDALQDPSDPGLQDAAASAIVTQGDDARALLPKLRALLNRPSTESQVRQIVLGIYRRLGPTALGEVDEIRGLLMRPRPEAFTDVDLSLAAACALVAIDGEHHPEAWSFVLDELDRTVASPQEESYELKPRCDLILDTLKQVGSAASRGAPVLIKLFKRQDAEIHFVDVRLIKILAAIGPEAGPVVSLLIKSLSESSWNAEEIALAVLAIDPRRTAYLRSVASKTEDDEACVAILHALDSAKLVDPGLGVLLAHNNRPRIRVAAAEILGRDQATAKITVPILVGMLTDDRPAVREQAARSLGSIQVTAGQVLPTLVSALRDDYIDVRAAAADALGQLASTDESVVLALKAAIADPNPYVSDAAAKALAVRQPAPVK